MAGGLSYGQKMFRYFFHVLFISRAVSISSPGPLTREVGQDVSFMFNATNIEVVNWGIRDGNTNNLKQGLIYYDIADGIQLDKKINSTPYAGRVSFVGDMSKGRAWFRITNLNINDTNQYMALIATQGASAPQPVSVQLTVTPPVTTTTPSSTPRLTSEHPTTQHLTTVLTATVLSAFTNLTTNLTVGGNFSEEMKNMSSSLFKDFSGEFEDAIRDAYSDKTYFKDVKVISLRKGSIVVTFVVFFKSAVDYKQACDPLEKAIVNDKLGSFKIVQGTLGCSKPMTPSPPSPPAPRTGVHPGIIAGVAIVGVLAIAGLVIAILFVCRKKASNKAYRNSTGPGPGPGPGPGHEMNTRYGEPEEQYASVQKPGASVPKQSGDQSLPHYAVVDKSKKNKKKTRESGELVYAVLDHDHNASMSSRPPSDRRSTGATGDTVYADIQSENKKQRDPSPQYGNAQDNSYA